MNGASGIGADLMNGANLAALCDDGFRHGLASLEFWTPRFFLRLRFVVANGNVLVAGQNLAAFLRLAIGGADLNKVWFRSDLCGCMSFDLGLIAAWVGALCGIWANCKSFLLAPRRRASSVVTVPMAESLKPPVGD
jgi:hypothetical protein